MHCPHKGRERDGGERAETRAVTLNAELSVRRFSFALVHSLLLLLCFIFFLAQKPKNPNEAKRMCCRPGQEEIATGSQGGRRSGGERKLFCHWIFV